MTTATETRKEMENTLIAAAQAGDHEAFNTLMARHEARMRRTAMRITAHVEDAEDAVQQAFTSAWMNLKRFRGDSAFSTWLTRITMNEALSLLRKRNRRTFVAIDEQVRDDEEAKSVALPAEGNPEQSFLERELKALVRESMTLVRPAYREAMCLRVLEDLSLEEIAERMGIPVNTVKVHLFRGRRAMKAFLAERLSPAHATV
ncbi:MAG: sigma-70 family RNA polymerase sigma factor [Bryobacteraceae bacterium]|nr:sigma-70 family RNA polymerase sigma factor [Bryobacteraceae bacterium]